MTGPEDKKLESADVYTRYLVDCPHCVTENDVPLEPGTSHYAETMKCDHCGETFGLDYSEVE